MDVPVALMADAANISSEGKLNLLGVFSNVLAREFPFAQRGGALVFIVTLTAMDEGDHDLQLVLIDDDGRQMAALTANLKFRIKIPEAAPIESWHHVIFPFPGVPFEEPGGYRFDLLINGRFMAAIPLTVSNAE